MVSIVDLEKRYRGTIALNGLQMMVPRGSVYGFVGPNGAGKTTTMRILATLLDADKGTCTVGGLNVERDAGRVRACLGFMPDFFGVYDDLTVQEYLEFYAAGYHLPARQRRATINDLLELVDLQHKRHAFVEALSRGMKQRLGLARCLVHDPDLLLLDEPASGMDPRARYEMREILKELQHMGKTVLVSSHILPELADVCTHVGIIQDGRIVREGPVDRVLRRTGMGIDVEVTALGETAEVVRVLERLEPVAELLPAKSRPDAPGMARITFRTFGGDAELVEVLRALVRDDMQVVSFSPVHDNLEDVFLQITEPRDA
jgi:ABC-2 type transport system ATP-binding protein